jgi:tetratricopeptide (TPR) repeat protein
MIFSAKQGGMMRWHYLRHGFPIALLSLFIFQNAHAYYEVDPSTFVSLPRHCQARYASIAAKLENIHLDRARYEKDIERYKRELQGAWIFFNHYCPGLVALIRAERLPPGANNDRRNRLIAEALKQVEYLLPRATWTESTLWLKAEANRNLGRIYVLKEQPSEAIRHFQRAIDAYPAYIPAYWDLAELKRKQQHFDEAISHLEKALSQQPNAKQASLIEAQIRKIESEKNSVISPENDRTLE